MPRAKLFATAFAIATATACANADGELSLVFPDEQTRSTATSVAVTVFEPLRQNDSGSIELVSCDRVGTFPATRILDPEKIPLGGGLGRVLGKFRDAQDYPLDDSLDVDFTGVPEGDQSNPWGLAMVLVEARGSVRSADPTRGSPISTIATACTCIALREGRARDAALDNQIKSECPTLEAKPDRDLVLKPVLPSTFRIEPCIAGCATAVPGGIVGGASACVVPVPCTNEHLDECFDCDDVDCPERNDLSNVPVLFKSGDKTELLLSGADGEVQSRIEAGSCTEGQTITARVLGTTEDAIEQNLACVPAISGFDCTAARMSNSGGDLVAFDALGPKGVLLLHAAPGDAWLTTFDARAPQNAVRTSLPGRTAQGAHAYYYDAGPKTRPLIAVASTVLRDISEQLRIDLYDWSDAPVPTATLAATCAVPTCATDACITGARADRRAAVSDADIDNDGFNDLAIAGDSQNAVVVGFLSTMANDDLYQQTGCTCGQYGGSVSEMVLGDFGGTFGSSIDVLLASGLGPNVAFGGADRRLPDCSANLQVGRAAGIRDLARGDFGCEPNGAPELACGPCGHGSDIVAVGGELAGFRSPALQIIFATDKNDYYTQRKNSTLALAANTEGEMPSATATGDLNGDGADDLALLYPGSGLVRVWLGARNGALAESTAVLRGSPCADGKLLIADFDGDGRGELALACTADSANTEFRRCVPTLTQPR